MLLLTLVPTSLSRFRYSHSNIIYILSSEMNMYAADTSTEKKIAVAGVDQDELLEPKVLADPDSSFCEFEGVTIHHKVYNAAETHNSASLNLPFPIILLHGFGASVFSWSRAMKPLAHLTASKVVAFDRPAFGLTSRPHSSPASKSLNPYSMAFSVLATLYFIDFLAAPKAVIVGYVHSFLFFFPFRLSCSISQYLISIIAFL